VARAYTARRAPTPRRAPPPSASSASNSRSIGRGERPVDRVGRNRATSAAPTQARPRSGVVLRCTRRSSRSSELIVTHAGPAASDRRSRQAGTTRTAVRSGHAVNVTPSSPGAASPPDVAARTPWSIEDPGIQRARDQRRVGLLAACATAAGRARGGKHGATLRR